MTKEIGPKNIKRTMKYILSVALLLSACGLAAQDHRANLDEATAAIVKELRAGENQELFLHTDKRHYKLGTQIWFHAYLFNALTRLPAKSARVHVDLVNASDSLHASLLLNSASNEMDGSIRTSSKWKPGAYILKVYTEEMALNPALGRPLEEPVFLFGDDVDPQAKTLAERHRPGIGFYPEGGGLINGVDNTVAFRCVNEQGVPMVVSGYLRDDQGKITETFKTSVPGYGKFSFMPSKNRSYQAFITMPDRTERSYPLPASAPGAWQLALSRTTPTSYIFRVAQGDSLYPLKPVSYVAAIAAGRVVYASIGNGLYEFSIQKAELPQGPVDVYLFNDRKQVVSRRQLNVTGSLAQVNVTSDKQGFSSREFINLDIDVKDGKGQPLSAILSVSVTDDRYVGLPRGGIRNEWMDITDPVAATPFRYPPIMDSVMSIRGLVARPDGGAAAGQVLNLVSTKDNLLLTDTSDGKGIFAFRVPEFYEGKAFSLQVTDAKGVVSPVKVQTFPQSYTWPAEPRTWVADTSNRIHDFNKVSADSFLTGNSIIAINNALNNAPRGKKPAMADVRNRNSRMITGEQLDKLGLGTTSQAVMMLPGIVMVNGKITITGGTGSIGGGEQIEPLVVTDGIPAVNSGVAQYLNSIPPQNIESIEVMTGPEAAQFGTRGINGVILVKTAKSIRETPMDAKSGLSFIRPQGYHETQAFYMPPYNEPAVRSMAFTDNRSTIYWKGEAVTDKNGKVKVSFYAADQPSSYTVHIKGISSKGELLDKTVRIGMK